MKPGAICLCGHPYREHRSLDEAVDEKDTACFHKIQVFCRCEQFISAKSRKQANQIREGESSGGVQTGRYDAEILHSFIAWLKVDARYVSAMSTGRRAVMRREDDRTVNALIRAFISERRGGEE